MRTRAVGHSGELEAAQSLGFLVGSSVCLILSVIFGAQVLRREVRPPQSALAERVNPNEAPAASLARLPGIGPARARAIVAFRDRLRSRADREPVFQDADDLERVRGIGPATVEGVRPWLWFDPPPGEGCRPPVE